MDGDNRHLTLSKIIEPEHLVQAIANSLEHSDETTHGTTGLTFKGYTIIVHKRKGLSWYIECKFKRGERETRCSST
jgi:hypothetical protein